MQGHLVYPASEVVMQLARLPPEPQCTSSTLAFPLGAILPLWLSCWGVPFHAICIQAETSCPGGKRSLRSSPRSQRVCMLCPPSLRDARRYLGMGGGPKRRNGLLSLAMLSAAGPAPRQGSPSQGDVAVEDYLQYRALLAFYPYMQGVA